MLHTSRFAFPGIYNTKTVYCLQVSWDCNESGDTHKKSPVYLYAHGIKFNIHKNGFHWHLNIKKNFNFVSKNKSKSLEKRNVYTEKDSGILYGYVY